MLTINNTLDGYLKNVEIKGNTVQGTDLADIRSVGDKLEGQDLYEIPLLCCGKNLFDGKLELGDINSSHGSDIGSSVRVRSINYQRVNANTEYVISNNKKATVGIRAYNENKEYIENIGTSFKFTTPVNCCYIRFIIVNIEPDLVVQLEEGTQATAYEPYKEDKLTILSPYQLEKVGDVADRIVEKDGVWGVWDNSIDISINGSENWSGFTIGAGSVNTVTLAINENNATNNVVICDKFKFLPSNEDEEHIRLANTKEHIRVFISKDKAPTLADFKAWCSKNSFKVKYCTDYPTFIPLPHDQQVKLRTFANETNISFLTEIEGTIKADVPKSLGATVNTHTTQIGALNNELERVKKLEQSTVSTVVTDKDFTVVEQTSNGYFEDITLQGRTCLLDTEGNEVEVGTEGATLTSVGDGTDEIVVSSVNENLCPITEFTAVVTKNTDTTNKFDKIICRNIKVSKTDTYRLSCIDKTNASLFFMHNEPISNGIDSHNSLYTYLVTGGKGIQVQQNALGKGYNYITVTTGGSFPNSLAQVGETVTISNLMINKGTTAKPYTPHKTDKKRLLFYNPTTEKWEKPVLREWDSVEKHSDGKYYYHKRSEEVVLDGSESGWVYLSSYSSNDIGSFELQRFFESHMYEDKLVISDRFEQNRKFMYPTKEGITIQYLHFNIMLAKSKLTTQDVAGFKAWLQANNVTVVYQLAQEQVYECTNLDLITYPNETNFVVKSGVLTPNMTLKYHGSISNVVQLLQKKVSLLESNITGYMITQNRLMLVSRYSADRVTFKVDYNYTSETEEKAINVDYDLFDLLMNNIVVGKDNYDYDEMISIMDFYVAIELIDWDMWDKIWLVMELQHNPPIEEVPEETPEI